MITFLPQVNVTQAADTSNASAKGSNTTDQSFADKIQGMMGTGTSSTQTTKTSETGSLSSLIKADQSAADEMLMITQMSESELMAEAEKLIGSLIDALEESGDQLNDENSELLAELNVWLTQMLAALYPQTEENRDSGSGESVQIVNALAEEPRTVRFAVQEVLHQLVEASMGKKTDGNELTNNTIHTELITSLKDILQKANIDTESLTKLQNLTEEIAKSVNPKGSDVPAALDNKAGLLDVLQKAVTPQNDSSNIQSVDETDMQLQKAGKAEQPVAVKDKVEETSSPVPSAEEAEVVDSEPTTAGQLVLRSGTAQVTVTKPEMSIPAGQFAKDMSEFVIQKFEIVKQNGVAEAVISLRPEHLGQVDVQLSMQNGQLVARFMTEHLQARDLLEQQMSQLRTALQAQGIQVDRLEVTQNTSLSSHMYQDGGSSSGQTFGEQRKSREREQKDDDTLKTAEIQDELRTWMREQQDLEVYPSADHTQGFTAKA
ncbi:flagellar hook-length control protein FliK [Neobacillus mesonae]|nr:flagellar hook-length control protein FliK [Neobacillus mesonae]